MSLDRKTSPVAVVEDAIRRMTPELREQYQAVRRLLSTATAADARSRHRVGVIVLEIKRSEDHYGARAVPLLAKALSRNDATLYRYASIAEAWTENEVEHILLMKMPGGEPVSWCHLQEIASAAAENRERLLRETIAKGLSVRDLSARVRTARAEASAEPRSRPLIRLNQLAAACEAIARFAIDDAFLERVLASRSEQAAEIVERALSAQSTALRLLERNMVQLRKLASTLPMTAPPEASRAPTTLRRSFFPRLLSGGSA